MIALFDVAAAPAVQGNHRTNGQGRIYEASSARLRDWREAVQWAAKAQMGRQRPATGPISLKLTFRLRPPKRHAGEWQMTRPDLDKLVRAVCDALTAIVYVDDGQIVSLSAAKRWAGAEERPGCEILAIAIPAGDAA